MNFDLIPRTEPVQIGPDEYVLREASADAAIQYRAAREACYTRSEDGKVNSIKGLATTESLLVSLCLFRCLGGTSLPTPVNLEVIKGWPYRIQAALYTKALEMSELEPKPSPQEIREQIARLQKQLKEVDLPLGGAKPTEGSSVLPSPPPDSSTKS